MSKKIIAVAAAAALALTGLVVMPTVASAVGPFAVSVAVSDTLSRAGAAADGSTGSLELTILVPSQDVLRLDAAALPADSTSGTLLRFKVTTPAGGAAVTATAALGGAKLVTQAQVTAGDLTTASGAASISVTSDTSGDVTFYAYTTSTADSTITVASGSNSKVLFMKGVSGKLNSYKLNFTASPLATAAAGKVTFTGTITDMFGNLMTSVVDTDIVTTGLGGNLSTITEGAFAQSSTTGVITFTAVNRDTAGSAAISIAMHTTLTAVAGAPVKVAAYGDPVGTQFFAVSAVDLSASVTALTAQVAALTAQLAVSRLIENSVTQKKYNTLARKWNKANPGAKVALKK
jgi:hypothetical protein